jgi:bacterioferritin-associated ferredoxin
MYVCLCNAVTEREVRHAVQLGADSFREVQDALAVGTCCGKCTSCAKGIIKDEKKQLHAMACMGAVPA